MIGAILSAATLVLAAIPTLNFLRNLRFYRPAPPRDPCRQPKPSVSVLIPARNEQASIAACVEAAAASQGVELEVIVLDDHSSDRTFEIVAALANADARIRIESAPPLPPGWSGKQHACAILAQRASLPRLAFLDADVRLRPDGLARMVAFQDQSAAELVSGVPCQQTSGVLDTLLIPLIHYVLLSLLPLQRMRRSRDVGYGAGCGQLFLCQRQAYEQSGGHATIRDSLHDGVKLPRAFRAAGFRSDLCDATDIAVCRMYANSAATWQGLAKNATEGLGAPALILPATLLLGGGQVLPSLLTLAGERFGLSERAATVAALAWIVGTLPRLIGVWRFQQSLVSAVLHPLGVALFLLLQWYALARWCLGRPAGWKGRDYAT